MNSHRERDRDAHEELRVYGEPQWELGFEAVTVHPLADEVKTLERLGMTAAQCTSCGIHWVVKERLCFVAIESTTKSPRVYFRRDDRGPSFTVWTRVSPLTSATVSIVLRWLDAWIAKNVEQFGATGTTETVAISESDVG